MGEKDGGGGFDQNWLPPITIKSLKPRPRDYSGSSGQSAGLSTELGTEADRIPLAVGSGKSTARIRAILNAAGGVAIGIGLFIIGGLISSIFSGRTSDLVILGAISLICAGGGITLGVLNWRAWSRDFYLRVGENGLEITHVGFRHPMFVSRQMVRVVAIDDSTQGTKRFPIREKTNDLGLAPTVKDGREPIDRWASPFADSPSFEKSPEEPGWAAPLRTFGQESPDLHDQDFLYSPASPRGESGLAFLKLNREDVPNVAVIFHEPVETPKSPLGVDFPNLNSGWTVRSSGIPFGGRKVPGVMLTTINTAAVRSALDRWKVVRPISEQDVFEEGIFRPRRFTPRMRGVLLAVGIVILWILRAVFDLDEVGFMSFI